MITLLRTTLADAMPDPPAHHVSTQPGSARTRPARSCLTQPRRILAGWLTMWLAAGIWAAPAGMAQTSGAAAGPSTQRPAARPNILIALSDDQSWPHAGAYGTRAVRTPAFDSVAARGILFHSAFSAAPGCAPSRSSIHTGRYHWQNREAGGHMSLFPTDVLTFPFVLERAGYHIGYTGKGVEPFEHVLSGWDRNPAGTAYNRIAYSEQERRQAPFRLDPGSVDYAANFEAFLDDREPGEPFYFFFGSNEAHRTFDDGSGARAGKDPAEVVVPGWLPDIGEVRGDMLDYFLELEWFDRHLGRMLAELEARGELDNTLVIVTADQGMAFPRAKANLYDGGLHVPLAVMWPGRISGGREIQGLASLVDLAPTVLDAAGVAPEGMLPITARSMLPLLLGAPETPATVRDAVFAGRERHTSARWANLGYPTRSARTESHLYIRNFAPERWPAGAPAVRGGHLHGLGPDGRFDEAAYYDIDASPTKRALIERMEEPAVAPFFELAVGRRPAEELYDVRCDPFQLVNLAGDPDHRETLAAMRALLEEELMRTGDPRVAGPVHDVFENYQRFGVLRSFPVPDWVSRPGMD